MVENYAAIWIVTSAILLFFAFLRLSLRNGRKKVAEISTRLPPGGRGWPLIGDGLKWFNAISGSHPPSFVEDQVERYGKIFSCSLFGRQTVVSADPAFNRFVLQNEGRLFQSSYPKSFRDLVGKHGVIVVQGEQQRKLHGIAVNMMRLERLSASVLGDIERVILQTLNSFQDNQVIILQDVCRKVAINLMVNQLLGDFSKSEINEMAHLFSDFVDGCLSFPIKLPGFSYHTAMKARETIIDKIKKKMKKIREQPESVGRGGVLRRLVEEEGLPDDVTVDFVINLLFAGNETTAKTMLFAVYFLTQCPNALEQLLDEQQSISRRCKVKWEDYKAMPFTQCVIHETLRLGGIAIWLMREAKEDVQYQEFMIPKGFFIVPFLSAVHLDETLYPGALTFNPWRWLDEKNHDTRNWRTSPIFTPFGGGARYCPGAELSRIQISLFLHHFATKFRWIQVKEDRMSFFPSARMVNGFQIRMTKRSEMHFLRNKC